MTNLWVKEIIHHRIARSVMTPLERDEDLIEVLGTLCAGLDIPRPMFLGKHEREWERFGQTSFTRDHFVERVTFDKLEIERVDADAKKRKSSDPRNG